MTVAIYNIYFWKDMLVLDVTSVDSLNYTLDFFIDYAEKNFSNFGLFRADQNVLIYTFQW